MGKNKAVLIDFSIAFLVLINFTDSIFKIFLGFLRNMKINFNCQITVSMANSLLNYSQRHIHISQDRYMSVAEVVSSNFLINFLPCSNSF